MKHGIAKNRIISIIALAALFLTASVGAVFAYVILSSNAPAGGRVTTTAFESVVVGEEASSLILTDKELNTLTQELSFANAGDSFDFDITVRNSTAFPISCKIAIAKLGDAPSDLSSAIIVYYDGELLGSLGELCNGGAEATLGENCFVMSATQSGAGYASTESKHRLSLALHVASANSYYAGKTVSVRLKSYASTIDYGKTFVVRNETELRHAIYDINTGLIEDSTVVLAGDVSLTGNYEIKRPCAIDLLGNRLIFGSYGIRLTQSGVVKLTSTVAPSSVSGISAGGGFIVDGEDAVFAIDDFKDNGGNNAGLAYSAVTEVESCDTEAVREILIGKYLRSVGNGVMSGRSADVFGAMKVYTVQTSNSESALPLVSVFNPTADYALSDGVLTSSETEVSCVTSIIIGGTKYGFPLFGTDDGALAELLANELSHVPDANKSLTAPNVSHDLFLPKSFESKGVSIEWYSDSPDVMDHDGRINPDLRDATVVTLTAVIRINAARHVHNFTFRVFAVNNAMKLSYFLALLNPITLREVGFSAGSHYLPMASGAHAYTQDFYRTAEEQWEAYDDIGIETITYSVDGAYSYVTVDSDGDGFTRVYLNQPVFYTYAQLDVAVTFTGDFDDNGDPNVYNGVINVLIELGSDSGLNEIVFNYIDGELSAVDVLENILSTRRAEGMARERGDFRLPAFYMNYTIAYEPSEADGIISGIDLYRGETDALAPLGATPVDGDYYVVRIDAEKFGLFDKDVLIRTMISNPNLSVENAARVLSFGTPGAIHCDEEGFYDGSVFHSVKYQVFQQLPSDEQTGDSGFVESGGTVTFDGVADYILLRDVVYCRKLTFDNRTAYEGTGNGDPLIMLINWATSTTNKGDTAYSVVNGSSGASSVNDNSYISDGKSYLTLAEISAIKAYCKALAPDKSAEIDALFTEVTTVAPGYVVSDANGMTTAINALINNYTGSFYNGSNNKVTSLYKFNEIMQWATNLRDFGLRGDPASGALVDYGPPNSGVLGTTYGRWAEDHLDTISENEMRTIEGFFISAGSSTRSTSGNALYNGFLTIRDEYFVIPTYVNSDATVRLCRLVKGTDMSGAALATAGDDVRYAYVRLLDETTEALEYFTALEELNVYGSDREFSGVVQGGVANVSVLSPIFTNTESITAFFNRLSSENRNIERLVMQNASLASRSNLDISSITNFNRLAYVDFNGCSGISSITHVTDMPSVTALTYLDVRGADCELEYVEPILAYVDIVSEALIYCNDGLGNGILYEVDADRSDLLKTLSYLDDVEDMSADYLQLTKKLYGDAYEYDITWQIEKGNPIEELTTAVTGEIKTTAAAMNAVLDAANAYNTVLYLGENTGEYTRGKTYDLTNVNGTLRYVESAGSLNFRLLEGGDPTVDEILALLNSSVVVQYAGATQGGYVNNAIYELRYTSGAYSYAPLSATQLAGNNFASTLATANANIGFYASARFALSYGGTSYGNTTNGRLYRFVLSADGTSIVPDYGNPITITSSTNNSNTLRTRLTGNTGNYYRYTGNAASITVGSSTISLTRNSVYTYDGTNVWSFATAANNNAVGTILDAANGYLTSVYQASSTFAPYAQGSYYKMKFDNATRTFSEFEALTAKQIPTYGEITEIVSYANDFDDYTYFFDLRVPQLYEVTADGTEFSAAESLSGCVLDAETMQSNVDSAQAILGAGSIYHYTGASGGGYTQNGVYQLQWSGGQFAFPNYIVVANVTDNTMTSALANATFFDCGNYYYYNGNTCTVNGFTFTKGGLYRLMYGEDGFYFTNAHDKAATITEVSDIDAFLRLAFEATDADLGKLYKLTSTAGDLHTYERNRVYEICYRESSGGYYLKLFGAASFENVGNIVSIDNDRLYRGENYAGTGTTEEVIISATIESSDGQICVRKYKFNMIG